MLVTLRLAASVVTLLLAATSLARAASVPRDRGDVVLQHDIIFGKGGNRNLRADIAWPKNARGPLPALIHLHGGGWAAGSYRWDSELAKFARAGYFATSIEYRLSGTAKWPAQIEGCKCAVRWLRANAAKYNVDPGRIGVVGMSAGGHLAACLDTMTGPEYEGDGGWPGVSSAVQAIVDFFGPTDFTRPANYSWRAVRYTEALFGVSIEKDPALWKSASPLFFVKPGDAPVLIIHGDADQLVPLVQSQLFAEALDKAGVPNHLLIVHHGRHGLIPSLGKKIDPGWPVIRQTAIDFLAKYLKSSAGT